MAKIPLHSFNPLNSRTAILRLVEYIAILKSKERYSFEECISQISDEALKSFFFDELVKRGVANPSDQPIKHLSTTLTKDRSQSVLSEKKNESKKKTEKTKIENNIKQEEIGLTKKERNRRKKLHITMQPVPRLKETQKKYSTLIVTDVEAKDFIIDKGIIRYSNCELRSEKIVRTISYDILSQITNKFTVFKVITSDPDKNNRFRFSRPDDLDSLLDEANLIYSKINKDASPSISTETYPQDGTFELPWDNVTFKDGRMQLTHPNTAKMRTILPFVKVDSRIHSSYNDIIGYIKKNCRKFRVTARHGAIVHLNNFEDFAKMIPHLREHTSVDDIKITYQNRVTNTYPSFTLEQFRELRAVKKSPYLALLSKHQSPEHMIYYILENVVHKSSILSNDEFGYLFTVSVRSLYTFLIFENISDESRSTLVFKVQTRLVDQARKVISSFLASDLQNKREKLARNEIRITDYSIIDVMRINHNVLNEWRFKFLSVIK